MASKQAKQRIMKNETLSSDPSHVRQLCYSAALAGAIATQRRADAGGARGGRAAGAISRAPSGQIRGNSARTGVTGTAAAGVRGRRPQYSPARAEARNSRTHALPPAAPAASSAPTRSTSDSSMSRRWRSSLFWALRRRACWEVAWVWGQ